MAVKGMSEFRADGENYTINDPNIANEFSTYAAYAAGDYVYYQGNLYHFTAAHAAGAWTGTDATQVKLGVDVSDLKSAMNAEVRENDNILSNVAIMVGTRGTDGIYRNPAGTTTATTQNIVPVLPLRVYIMEINGFTSTIRIFFYTSLNETDMIVTNTIDAYNGKYYIVVPSNCVGFSFHGNKDAVLNSYIRMVDAYNFESVYDDQKEYQNENKNIDGLHILKAIQISLDGNGLANTNGVNAYRLVTDYIKLNNIYFSVIVPDGIDFAVSYYTANDYVTARISSDAWTSNKGIIAAPANAKYIRLSLMKHDNSAIGFDDLDYLAIQECQEDERSNLFGAHPINLQTGGLDSNGLNNPQPVLNRLRSVGYCKANPGSVITIVVPEDFQVSVSLYSTNDNTTARSYSAGWSQKQISIIMEQGCQYFRVTVCYLDQSNLVPEDVSYCYYVINNDFDVDINQDMDIKSKIVYYFGNKLVKDNALKYTEKRLYGNSYKQGGAIYKNYYVSATQTNNTLYIYDIASGALLGNVSVPFTETFHFNSMCFDKELHSGNNNFPYLIVSQWNGDKAIGIIDLNISNGSFDASVVQLIYPNSLSAVYGEGSTDFAIDFDNSILYIIKYKLDDTTDFSGENPQIVTKFELPEFDGSNVTLTDSDVLDSFSIEAGISFRQQSVYFNDCIYVVSGYDDGKLSVIDISNKALLNSISLKEIIGTNEPQAINVNNGFFYLTDAQTDNLYKIQII